VLSIAAAIALNFYYNSLLKDSVQQEQIARNNTHEAWPLLDHPEVTQTEVLNLIPHPRKVVMGSGKFIIPGSPGFKADPEFQDDIKKYMDRLLLVDANAGSSSKQFFFKQSDQIRKEGYLMHITPRSLTIAFKDMPGLYYSLVSLKHLNISYPGGIPSMTIEDYPDMEIRGVMLDIGRDKIPTLETVLMLCDMLSELKYNHVELYMEGFAFAYEGYRELWEATETPFTAEEFRKLDAWCSERFIDLVPNQNTLGHMTAWLATEQLEHLAECPDGYSINQLMKMKGTLDPYNPGSIELVENMLDELLPNFSSGYFNANLDEPFELGRCRSKEAAEEKGVDQVFLEYVIKVNDMTKASNKKMLMWGDMPSNHPDIIPDIPQDITVMEWGYEAEHPFDQKCEKLAAGGVDFLVCPGTSSWTTFSGRTNNMYNNISNAVKSGMKHGAKGMVVTDWGDMGHWQYLPVSYAGFAWGAGWSWNSDGLSESLLTAYLNTFIYRDRNNIMGNFSLDLGRYNRFEEILMFNMTLCNLSYQLGLRDRIMYEKVIESLEGTLNDLAANQFNTEEFVQRFSNKQAFQYEALRSYISSLEDSLSLAEMQLPDSLLILDEYTNAIRMIRMGADLKNYVMARNDMENGARIAYLEEMKSLLAEILVEHERLWLTRNRLGGLPRSKQVMLNLQLGIEKELSLLKKGSFARSMNRFREKVMTAGVTLIL